VYTGIAGSHVRSLNSHGIVAIRDKEVSPGDVDRVIDAAQAVAIPADQKILHILPQEFLIDSQEGIREPVGMSGVRLEAKVHMVTGAESAAQNIVKCVQRCGLEVDDIVLEQLASSYSVLTDDEKELGSCIVAYAVCRGNQDQVCLRPVAARESGRDDRSAERRRAAAAKAGATDARGNRRAQVRGTLWFDPR
jgi:cell division protein FtsA